MIVPQGDCWGQGYEKKREGIDNQLSHLVIYVQSTYEVEDREEYICDWALQRANGSGSLARNRRMEWAREMQSEPQGVGAAGSFRRYHGKEYQIHLVLLQSEPFCG